MINKIAFIPREVLRFADELDVIAREVGATGFNREMTMQFTGNFLASICNDARSILILAPELRRFIEAINDGDCEVYEANEQQGGIFYNGRAFEMLPLRDAVKQDRPFLRVVSGVISLN